MESIDELKSEIIVLRNRIAELERENNELCKDNARLRRRLKGYMERVLDTAHHQGFNW